MVEAKKTMWTQFRFRSLHNKHLRKAFHKLYVTSGYMPNEAIFMVNHSGWWDALVLFELEQKRQIPPVYTMMDATFLTQYPLFLKNGAFAVKLEQEEEAIKSFQYADLLLTEGKSIALFPQGKPQHQDVRPLQLAPTIMRLPELCRDIPIVLTTLYYTYRDGQKGEIWVRFGDPIYPEHVQQMTVANLEQLLTEQLDIVREQAIQNDTDGYTNLL